MKFRSILINALAVVIMSGALIFAVFEFVKSRQQSTMGQQLNQLHSQSEQIHYQQVQNSILKIRTRALNNDKTAIDKVVRDRMGMMRSNETYVPFSAL